MIRFLYGMGMGYAKVDVRFGNSEFLKKTSDDFDHNVVRYGLFGVQNHSRLAICTGANFTNVVLRLLR